MLYFFVLSLFSKAIIITFSPNKKGGLGMDAKVKGKDLVELQLNPSDFYLSEKKLRELIRLLERKLFELKDFERAAILAEKQGVFKLEVKGGDEACR
jgi:hypothetical protein